MRRRGIALPLVLWGIAFLSGIVILLSVRMKERIEQEGRAERAFRARQLALRGLALGRHPGVQPGDAILSSGDPDDEGYEVRISDESGRINPNFWAQSGDRSFFRNLFGSWEIPLQESDAAIDAMLDWIDGDDLRSMAGAEAPEYTQAGMKGLPANAPFSNVEEMGLVLNLRDVLAARENWRDLFTIHHSGKINIQHAGPGVFQSVAGLVDRQIEAILEFRSGLDGIEGTEDDPKFGSVEDAVAIAAATGAQADALRKFFDTSGSVRRIESTGFAGGIRRTVTAVVGDGGASPLAWEER